MTYESGLCLRLSQLVDFPEDVRRRFLHPDDREWLRRNYFVNGLTTDHFLAYMEGADPREWTVDNGAGR
jgi:hypothetical protein